MWCCWILPDDNPGSTQRCGTTLRTSGCASLRSIASRSIWINREEQRKEDARSSLNRLRFVGDNWDSSHSTYAASAFGFNLNTIPRRSATRAAGGIVRSWDD
jgi:hypothetical protein